VSLGSSVRDFVSLTAPPQDKKMVAANVLRHLDLPDIKRSQVQTRIQRWRVETLKAGRAIAPPYDQPAPPHDKDAPALASNEETTAVKPHAHEPLPKSKTKKGTSTTVRSVETTTKTSTTTTTTTTTTKKKTKETATPSVSALPDESTSRKKKRSKAEAVAEPIDGDEDDDDDDDDDDDHPSSVFTYPRQSVPPTYPKPPRYLPAFVGDDLTKLADGYSIDLRAHTSEHCFLPAHVTTPTTMESLIASLRRPRTVFISEAVVPSLEEARDTDEEMRLDAQAEQLKPPDARKSKSRKKKAGIPQTAPDAPKPTKEQKKAAAVATAAAAVAATTDTASAAQKKTKKAAAVAAVAAAPLSPPPPPKAKPKAAAKARRKRIVPIATDDLAHWEPQAPPPLPASLLQPSRVLRRTSALPTVAPSLWPFAGGEGDDNDALVYSSRTHIVPPLMLDDDDLDELFNT
jgi:hypothetical protein